MDREKVIKEFEHILNEARGDYLDFADITVDFGDEILALLKEQEEVVKQWKMEIAGNQLVHAPNDSHEAMSLDEHLENEYKRGIWDGLQIAWNIISEGR